MPKRTIGPFLALSNLPVIDINTADVNDLLDRCDLVNAVLADLGCCCNGHAAGSQRDPYWGGDLSELVCRCTSHEIQGQDVNGNTVTEWVSIKLDTLRVEIDANDEIMAWIYEES